ncbi:hypothetical protein B0A49_08987 [Cryomyces minteri]|uniref:Steroid 5-alpha reductase C-terminal domain-containing protein n=1 Tax=Cryomyces minteri TaxID=331657 RepID=A0A4U0WQE3_9PEZI|nr:hypothetical protein B0A49_08987 [Cryomyces minteri]
MILPVTGMSLPVVKTLADCADFSKTVSPFIPQLQTLTQQLLHPTTDSESLKSLYLSTNPLISGFALSLFLAPIFLVVSEFNKNYSQVDRCWSILPTLYNAHFTIWAHLNGLPTQRLDNVLAFSCLWSLRLTFNYWRKGGYSIGSEDYRWEVLREKIPPSLFFVFNVLFISLAQSVLLFSITTPTYVLLLASRLTGNPMTTVDLVFSGGMIALVLLEFFADNQQWNYQSAKKQYQKTAKVPPNYEREDLDRGFIVTGLFSLSRHPNFAAEQTIWVLLYQWCCYETLTFWNWTFFGAMSYLILFQASTWFTELVSSGKYPEYAEYQQLVGKFLPKLTGHGVGELRRRAVVKRDANAAAGKKS